MSKQDRNRKTNFLTAYETLCSSHSLLIETCGDVQRVVSLGENKDNSEIEAHMHMLWANTFEH